MDPKAISQDYLDEVGAAVMADNWASYTDCISRPFHLVTHDTALTFATPDDLRGIYLDFRNLLRTQRITNYIRLVDAAERIDRELIIAQYVTHLMSGGHRIMEPVRSGITLRLEGNRWRAASITNAVSSSRWPLLLPPLTADETPERTIE